MSERIYALRCVRCLLSVCGTEPRELAARIGAHECDQRDVISLEAFRAAAAWLDRITEEGKG